MGNGFNYWDGEGSLGFIVRGCWFCSQRFGLFLGNIGRWFVYCLFIAQLSLPLWNLVGKRLLWMRLLRDVGVKRFGNSLRDTE